MNLHEIYLKNRTIRRFTSEPVSRDDLLDIVDHARIVSCANNRQTLRFVIVSSKQKVEELEKMVHWAAALPPEVGRPHPGQFPPAYIVIVQTAPGGFSDIDTGIATQAMTSAACEKNLACCIFGSHKPSEVGAFLHLKETEKARLVIAVGHPAIHSTITEMKDNSTKYWMDEEENFYVPKRALKDIVTIE